MLCSGSAARRCVGLATKGAPSPWCGRLRLARGSRTVQRSKKWDDAAVDMIDNVMGTGGAQAVQRAKAPPPPEQRYALGNGVLILLAVNFGVYAAGAFLSSKIFSIMPLFVAKWHWWQLLSSAFVHANFQHLASNMFMLYVFGKTVEDEEGALGVIFTYLLCAVGGCLAFMWLNPRGVLVGASGAIFGLVTMSVLLKLRFNLRSLLELAAIAPFVYTQLTSNVAAQLSGAGGSVAYIAHLGGAFTGLMLVALLSLLPSDD